MISNGATRHVRSATLGGLREMAPPYSLRTRTCGLSSCKGFHPPTTLLMTAASSSIGTELIQAVTAAPFEFPAPISARRRTPLIEPRACMLREIPDRTAVLRHCCLSFSSPPDLASLTALHATTHSGKNFQHTRC